MPSGILDLLGSMRPPTKGKRIHGAYPLKIRYDRLSSFQDIKIDFLWFKLESPIHATKISFLGGVNLQNLGGHRSDPKRVLVPCAERRIFSPHWSRSDARCDVCASRENQKDN